MKEDIKIPAVGESITEATIAQWIKKSGDYIQRDEILLILETDKASVDVVAEHSGQLFIKVKEGETSSVGTVIGSIDTSVSGEASKGASPSTTPSKETTPETPPIKSPTPTPANTPPDTPSPPPAPPKMAASNSPRLSPAVRKIVAEKQLDPTQFHGAGKGGRLTKAEALSTPSPTKPSPTASPETTLKKKKKAPPPQKSPSHVARAASSGGDHQKVGASRPLASIPQKTTDLTPIPPLPQVVGSTITETRREAMSPLRKTIAKRLVQAQQTAAILTTFNEIDMTKATELRKKYKESFKEKYGVSLGFMGLFVKATVAALKEYPRVNASLDGNHMVFKDFVHMGIAVSTEKGLLVPVIRQANQLSVADIELSIHHYARKAREGQISLDDLSEGTFTISNGGIFGSLMSTPILNPPQSGILGLHKIEQRPVAVEGQVVIRPMMYVALSYDHRIIDGKESVGFLVKIKEGLEDPSRLLLDI